MVEGIAIPDGGIGFSLTRWKRPLKVSPGWWASEIDCAWAPKVPHAATRKNTSNASRFTATSLRHVADQFAVFGRLLKRISGGLGDNHRRRRGRHDLAEAADPLVPPRPHLGRPSAARPLEVLLDERPQLLGVFGGHLAR